jgi:hypothetical protein
MDAFCMLSNKKDISRENQVELPSKCKVSALRNKITVLLEAG